jgi:hypothetical protein
MSQVVPASKMRVVSRALRNVALTAAAFAAVSFGACAADHPGADADSCITTRPRTFPADGPCDDSEPVRGKFTLTPSGHYIVTCDAQPLDEPGCIGVPNDVWDACALRRCEPTVSYPKGCNLIMPTANPHFSSTADHCECTDASGELHWTCAG